MRAKNCPCPKLRASRHGLKGIISFILAILFCTGVQGILLHKFLSVCVCVCCVWLCMREHVHWRGGCIYRSQIVFLFKFSKHAHRPQLFAQRQCQLSAGNRAFTAAGGPVLQWGGERKWKDVIEPCLKASAVAVQDLFKIFMANWHLILNL